MSKAAAPVPAKKANSKDTPIIDCVLEDVLPTSSDSTIKVKKFKKFLDYDLKTLNITGELETYTHKNGFTHTKLVVTYQDKKTNKVNYLEIDVLDNTNTNKKVENTKNCNYSSCSCASGYTLYCGFDTCCNNETLTCCNSAGVCYNTASCGDGTYGTLTTNTAAGSAAGSAAVKTGKTNTLAVGTPVVVSTVGAQYTVTQFL